MKSSADNSVRATVVAQGAIVRKGDKGERVKEVQRVVGVEDDGFFGSKTELAVKNYQTKNSLGADGVVGPITAKAMGIKWVAPTANMQALAWNTAQHPERKEWTTHLFKLLDKHFDAFNSAADANSFHPNYYSLTREQKIFVWATYIVEIVRYECDFNPKSQMLESNGEISAGLLQMSKNDDTNYRLPYDFSFEDLFDPLKSLTLGLDVAAIRIVRDGVISAGSSATGWKGMARYWSTARMTTRLDEAKAKTNALKF